MLTKYVIQLTEFNGKYKAGAYAARRGSEKSYTYKLANAELYDTHEAAQANCCVGNERVVRKDFVT